MPDIPASIPPEIDARWEVRQQPPLLTRRFEFPGYGQTRRFLDQLAELSQRVGLYPDLNFAKTHVNVSISAQALGEPEFAFAREVDALWKGFDVPG
jgi:pterin-4a-carbinolamine dehydratase